MLPKYNKTERPPPYFSAKDWQVIRSFNIIRSKDPVNSEIDLKYVKLQLHNCLETALMESKSGEKIFARVSMYRFLKVRHLIGCKVSFFDENVPTVVLVGFDGKHFEDAPALSMRIGENWYYKEHIRGIEIFPNQQIWDKGIDFENATVRTTGMHGERGAYLKVEKIELSKTHA